MVVHDQRAVRDRTLFVCLRMVSIHAPLQPAIESGLFGRLGEERVTLVDATDTEHKEQYRAFWEKHGRRPDLNPYRFFDKWSQQGEWAREEAEGMQLLWLISRWYKEKGSVPNAAAVWKQKPSESDTDDYRRMFGVMDGRDAEDDWTPDKEHPWVRDTSASLPQVQPTVMFRLCTHDCPEARRRNGWEGGEDLFLEGA